MHFIKVNGNFFFAFWISPRDFLSVVSLVTIFQRNERGFEALVLTLVSNLAFDL